MCDKKPLNDSQLNNVAGAGVTVPDSKYEIGQIVNSSKGKIVLTDANYVQSRGEWAYAYKDPDNPYRIIMEFVFESEIDGLAE